MLGHTDVGGGEEVVHTLRIGRALLARAAILRGRYLGLRTKVVTAWGGRLRVASGSSQ